jgi:hypothetical protein
MTTSAAMAKSAIVALIAFTNLSLPAYITTGNREHGLRQAVCSDLVRARHYLRKHRQNSGSFPPSEEGIQVLSHQLKDPRGHDYIYRFPATKGLRKYDLFSPGPDGKKDTADDDWGE